MFLRVLTPLTLSVYDIIVCMHEHVLKNTFYYLEKRLVYVHFVLRTRYIVKMCSGFQPRTRVYMTLPGFLYVQTLVRRAERRRTYQRTNEYVLPIFSPRSIIPVKRLPSIVSRYATRVESGSSFNGI